MKIRILGAHNCEAQSIKLVSLLIDEALALDAGGLASSLPIEAQLQLKAILLTHQHYDHIRDIPAMGMNALFYETSIRVYSTQAVRDALAAHWLNGTIYSEFLERPPDNPRVKFTVIEPNQTFQIDGYDILTVPVNHTVPTVGYQVTSPDGKRVFYTGDTGPGLASCWPKVSPDLLITEVTAPNRYEEFGRKLLHLTPSLLKEELIAFQKLKGRLPSVVLVHMNPKQEAEIEAEIVTLAEELNTPITLAKEGEQINL
ncbi:MAG TPA: MBL fold metallo-hydrolase [Dehalococcoidia bacterium]|jgi:ribonuclease BN (tRNA processing enzyme)|nr:MBL fold metallo-hydrolase [Dehalococcoidia bacterium]